MKLSVMDLQCKVSGCMVIVFDPGDSIKLAQREYYPEWSKTYHIYAKIEEKRIIFCVRDELIRLSGFRRICSLLSKDKPRWKFWKKPEFHGFKQFDDLFTLQRG